MFQLIGTVEVDANGAWGDWCEVHINNGYIARFTITDFRELLFLGSILISNCTALLNLHSERYLLSVTTFFRLLNFAVIKVSISRITEKRNHRKGKINYARNMNYE